MKFHENFGIQPTSVRRFRMATGLAAAIALALIAPGAFAQSTTGGVYGKVSNKAEVIKIKSLTSGVMREIKPRSDGQYTMSLLNPGLYRVTAILAGGIQGSKVVTVRAGTMTHVSSLNLTTLATVVVASNAIANNFITSPIDTQTPELTESINSKLVNVLPVARSTENIALLSSNVSHDNLSTSSITIGGATAAENRYFLNGFDITNSQTGINSFSLPIEAVANTSIVTGGANARWTNTTGGAVFQTVKQGDNTYRAGADLYLTPASSNLLRPIGSSSYEKDGVPYIYHPGSTHYAPEFTENYWGSGPIIKNKLFFYALLGTSQPRDTRTYGPTTFTRSNNRDKNGLVNLTWDITNHQSLDLLSVRDRAESYTNNWGLDIPFDTTSVGDNLGWAQNETKTQYTILGYNWHVNEDLQLHLMAGTEKIVNSNISEAEAQNGGLGDLPPCAQVVDPVTNISTTISPSTVCTAGEPSSTKVHQFEGDATFWVGPNKIEAGAEYYSTQTVSVTQTVAGGDWTYFDVPGAILPNGNIVSSTDGHYVQSTFNQSGGNGKTIREGAFLQDAIQVTPRWLLYAGVRYDHNKYIDGAGDTLLITKTFSPRLGFAWDVHGDSTLKIGGSAGVYSTPEPSEFDTYNNAALEELSYYTYKSIGSNGAPVGKEQIGPTYIEDSGRGLPVYEYMADNVKAPKSYAYRLYAQQSFSKNWSGLIAVGYVHLQRIIADVCDQSQVNNYANTHGFPNYHVTETYNVCYDVNPGKTQKLTRDFAGNGNLTTFELPWSAYGMDGVKHHYYHLTAKISHLPDANEPYYFNASYTFRREFGNTDGLLDVARQYNQYIGRSNAFSDPQYSPGSNGNLSGDVRNTAVLQGIYFVHGGSLTGLRLSGVLRWQSGAPLSCLGTYPEAGTPAAVLHTNSSYYCQGVVQKAGSYRLSSWWALNFGVGYDWHFLGGNSLDASLKVTNVTNNQTAVNRVQASDTGQFITQTTLIPNPALFTASAFQQPRTFQFVLRYRFH